MRTSFRHLLPRLLGAALIAVGTAAGAAPAAAPPAVAAAKAPIDINSASRKQLKTLPGIGDAEAQRIIAHRPYVMKTDLVTEHVLPAGNYVAIKRLVIAKPKGKP